ncbi:MAG TPA: hypothetical protein PLA57_00820 [Candidatus Paceibacterota bacterium]|jgi:NAD kinase|nr:hypothetical protein [Candidatus Paceibacterota bacterium]
MKVIIFGDEKQKIEPLIKRVGFEVTDKNFDFVISFGGDGALIKSEYLYPEVPKIILRNSSICKKCSSLENEEILKRIKNGNYKIEKMRKLKAQVKNKVIFALNDIVIHNFNPRHAIRYKVLINGKEIYGEIIGDGIVAATPYGSTGYYRSITDSFFEVGLGLAFNNSTEQADHLVLKENSQIKIVITRGPAIVYGDNQEEEVLIDKNDEVLISNSNKFAKIVKVN